MFSNSLVHVTCRKKIIIFLAVIFCLNLFMQSSSYALDSKDKRVVIVSMPRVTWSALKKAQTPNMDHLIDSGSIGAMSAKVRGSSYVSSRGYATFSASRRAIAPDPSAGTFMNPEEQYNLQNVGQLFSSQRGVPWDKTTAGLGINFQLVLDANRQTLDQAQVGSFADMLESVGRSIGVYGNADMCGGRGPECFDRSIAYIGTSSQGVLKFGDISMDLISQSEGKARLEMNFNKLNEEFSKSINNHDVSVAECSDLERIDEMRDRMKSSVAQSDFIKAIQDCDTFIGNVTKQLDLKRDQLFIIAPNPPRGQEQLTLFIANGNGIPKGYASSSTTRIKGVLTLVDIAPSILRTFNIAIPSQMNKAEFDWRVSSDSASTRITAVNNINDQALAHSKIFSPANWFVAIIFLILVFFSLMAFTRGGKYNLITKLISICFIPLPLFVFLVQPWMRYLSSPFIYIGLISLLSILCAVPLWIIAKKKGYFVAITILCGLYLLVQIIDITTGARLQFNSLFGYSAIVAGRFSGLGNQSFALLASQTLIFVTGMHHLFLTKPPAKRKIVNICLVLFLILIIVLDGAPQLGSDVGGVLSLTPTFFLVAMMLFDKKVNSGKIIAAIFGTFVMVSIFALIDLSRPINKRTHLGRFVQDLIHGDGILTLQRKLISSLRSFTNEELVIVVSVGILYFIFLYAYKTKILERLIQQVPSIRLLIYPAMFLAIFGALLNDSGAIIPTLIFISIVPVVSLLASDLDEVKVE